MQAESHKRQSAEDDLARREYDLKQARASADEARAQALADRGALQAVHSLSEWPKDVAEVARLAVTLGRGRIVFADDAVRSLERSDFAGCSDSHTIIWQCLRAMADELHPLLNEGLPAQQVAEEFRKRSKFELTWTETKETKRDAKLVALRQVTHQGKPYDITPHIKWGTKPPHLLRVHFAVDRDSKQIVVGHCGDHLDTYGTRRRR